MNFNSNSNHFSKTLKMFCLLILLLFCVSIDCQNQTLKWCSLIKPNGIYKGLGIYRRFFENRTDQLVMFNKAGAEWLFDVTSDYRTGVFNISVNSVKNIPGKGVVYRFGTFHDIENTTKKSMDCRVETAVKLLNYNKLLLFSIN